MCGRSCRAAPARREAHVLVPDHDGPGGIVRLYGMQVFENGMVYSSDRRRRWRGDTNLLLGVPPRAGKKRRAVRAFSEASRRRLEFIAANTATVFRSLLSLTYHAPACSWSNPEENARVAKRSKTDLNRFLSCLREELGSYLWVQEFQKRGAIHYHVLCEKEIEPERVTEGWCRSIDALDDVDAMEHGALTERIRAEKGARSYVGRYVGKERQKLLPPGVEHAGRWWGRSRSMALKLVTEVVFSTAGSGSINPIAVQIVRGVRAYVSKRLGWKFRGGRFVTWGGRLSADVAGVTERLREFYVAQWSSGRAS